MRPYLAVLTARIRMLLQYRTAALAGLSTQFFWGLIKVMTFEAFYRSTTTPQPLSLDQVVSYIWMGQAMFALLPWTIDQEIRTMVRTGSVAYELARPVDLYSFWFSRNLAGRIAPTLLRSVPIFALALLAFGLQLPPSLAAAGAWFCATIGAVLLAGAVATLLSIALLWTISGEGVSQLFQVSIFVFSGMIVPLPLFPDWAQPWLNALPFRGLVDIPFRFYTGHLPPDQLVPHLAQQLAWTLALILLGRWLLSRGLRRLVVQGG